MLTVDSFIPSQRHRPRRRHIFLLLFIYIKYIWNAFIWHTTYYNIVIFYFWINLIPFQRCWILYYCTENEIFASANVRRTARICTLFDQMFSVHKIYSSIAGIYRQKYSLMRAYFFSLYNIIINNINATTDSEQRKQFCHVFLLFYIILLFRFQMKSKIQEHTIKLLYNIL